MSTLSNLPEQTRKTIFDIVARSNNDPDYQKELNSDPIATLKAAGLSSDVAEQVRTFDPAPDANSSEVEGYMRCVDGTCWNITIASICPASCWVTRF